MKQKKSLQELTFKDNFMFGAVMLDPENCKGILERTLGIEIERVEVSKEKSIVYNPEYKGVRLDVYAKDEHSSHYDVEMQVLRKPAVKKRARYYHGQLDMEILLSGLPYAELPDTYVIFICDYDPFGKGKYRYTQRKICKEEPELSMEDGAHTVFLSTKGTNVNEVPPALVRFLKFVEAPLSDSDKDFEDDFVRQLQSSVRKVKESREMGARYMTFEEFLNEEKEEAREEGRVEGRVEERCQVIIESLEELGSVPEELQVKIRQEKDLAVLKKWCRLAAKVEKIAQFEQEI
ncbi:MAG: Rpn family recombination-promoting nuclease/putative transposase [Tyzzerella sp.]|nr:Rpn family recombination-promoting nuclease/putative transposase [Tyzzerella sp.]